MGAREFPDENVPIYMSPISRHTYIQDNIVRWSWRWCLVGLSPSLYWWCTASRNKDKRCFSSKVQDDMKRPKFPNWFLLNSLETLEMFEYDPYFLFELLPPAIIKLNKFKGLYRAKVRTFVWRWFWGHLRSEIYALWTVVRTAEVEHLLRIEGVGRS